MKNDKITKEQLLKMQRKVRRDQELQDGSYRPSIVHKTSKRDQQDRKSNTIKDWEE